VRFTDASIGKLKPKQSADGRFVRTEYRDPECAGLYVVVQPSKGRSFAFRYRHGGLPAKLTIGPATIGLRAARLEASKAAYALAQGQDPGAARRTARQQAREAVADTLAAVGDEYFKREGCKLKTAGPRRAVLDNHILPTLGSRRIPDIHRSDIVRLLDKIEDGSGPAAADAALGLLRRVLNWHATRTDGFANPIVRGMNRTSTKETARSRILDDDEICRIWKATDSQSPFDGLIRLLLLTAARRSEAAEMTRSELVGNDWTLPAARNEKTGQDLVRPLSSAAMHVINNALHIAGCDFVFPTGNGKPLTNFTDAKRALDERSQVTDWRIHDLRRTARSLMSRAGVPSEHAERVLGHVIGGVEGVYDRHSYYDEKKAALQRLAALVEQIINPTDNVVLLARQQTVTA
jgi:integrase